METITLESKRLILRPLTLNHLSLEYVDWMNDIDVNRYLESGGDYTIAKLESFLKEQEKKNILFWAIHLKKTNKHIGNIKIDPIDKGENSGEYGIMMGDKFEWGKGYAKEASLAVIKFCFEKLNLIQITLGVVEDNINALMLYKKIGFKLEKVIMNHSVYQGQVCNYVRMIKRND